MRRPIKSPEGLIVNHLIQRAGRELDAPIPSEIARVRQERLRQRLRPSEKALERK